MTKLEPRTPAVSVPIYRHSGSFTPKPEGASDGNAGGQVPPSQYFNKELAADKDRV
jgi:hypothetical protein